MTTKKFAERLIKLIKDDKELIEEDNELHECIMRMINDLADDQTNIKNNVRKAFVYTWGI